MADEPVEVTISNEATPTGAEVIIIDKPAVAAPDPAPATQAAPAVVAPVAVATAPAVVSADEGIESLKDQITRAKAESARRLQEKDRQIQEAYDNARRAETAKIEAEQTVTSARQEAAVSVIDKLKLESEDARRKLKVAWEGGDFEAASTAQLALTNASARLIEAERNKIQLEERAKNPPIVQQQTIRQQPSFDNAAERYAATLTPKSAQWVRAHPEFAQSEEGIRTMVMAHHAALGEGHDAESDGYFDFINRKLVPTRAAEPAREAVREQPRVAAVAPASAPVSRDVGQAPAQDRPGTIRLSSSEVRTALDTYGPLFPKESQKELLERYARDKVALVKEGKIGRIAS